jgi:hypothetical protein
MFLFRRGKKSLIPLYPEPASSNFPGDEAAASTWIDRPLE